MAQAINGQFQSPKMRRHGSRRTLIFSLQMMTSDYLFFCVFFLLHLGGLSVLRRRRLLVAAVALLRDVGLLGRPHHVHVGHCHVVNVPPHAELRAARRAQRHEHEVLELGVLVHERGGGAADGQGADRVVGEEPGHVEGDRGRVGDHQRDGEGPGVARDAHGAHEHDERVGGEGLLPEVAVVQAEREHGEPVAGRGVDEREEEVGAQDLGREELVLLGHVVELGEERVGLGNVQVRVQDRPGEHRGRGEEHVERGHVQGLVEGLPRVAVVEAEHPLREGEGPRLVEEVGAHVRDAEVREAAVVEQEAVQVLELLDRVVRGARGLHALEAGDADADVGGADHRNVVRSVPNAEGPHGRHVLLDEQDDEGLL
mmetsp:Transcript_63250/g.142643  ORF Transcript_63250/g.142643 Transcript_63250/m.142643 type:complete len:370 (-) Transcript_63250:2512-3621(-)